jgi:hypothetical protein
MSDDVRSPVRPRSRGRGKTAALRSDIGRLPARIAEMPERERLAVSGQLLSVAARSLMTNADAVAASGDPVELRGMMVAYTRSLDAMGQMIAKSPNPGSPMMDEILATCSQLVATLGQMLTLVATQRDSGGD